VPFPWTLRDLAAWNPRAALLTRSHRPLASLQRLWAVQSNARYPAHTDEDLGLLTVFSVWYPGAQCLLTVSPLGHAIAANCAPLKLANPRVVASDWVAGFRCALCLK
jgi:hypothetical protein